LSFVVWMKSVVVIVRVAALEKKEHRHELCQEKGNSHVNHYLALFVIVFLTIPLLGKLAPLHSHNMNLHNLLQQENRIFNLK
jgi:hypothetical protein